VVTDIEKSSAERVAGELQIPGLAVHITDPAGIRSVAELATSELGPIDIWFSNAGYSGPPEPGELQNDEMWDLTWRRRPPTTTRGSRRWPTGWVGDPAARFATDKERPGRGQGASWQDHKLGAAHDGDAGSPSGRCGRSAGPIVAFDESLGGHDNWAE